MQGPNTTNSLFNNNTTCSNQPQIHFDTTSNDDFLKQMLSNLPSSSWNLHETTPDNNVVFPYDVEQANLASKFRNHQITTDNDKASALMLHHHLLLSSSAAAANSQLLHMPFDSSAPNDVVDAPSFKSLTPVGCFTPPHHNTRIYNILSDGIDVISPFLFLFRRTVSLLPFKLSTTASLDLFNPIIKLTIFNNTLSLRFRFRFFSIN